LFTRAAEQTATDEMRSGGNNAKSKKAQIPISISLSAQFGKVIPNPLHPLVSTSLIITISFADEKNAQIQQQRNATWLFKADYMHVGELKL
jgi:hypothetical protein